MYNLYAGKRFILLFVMFDINYCQKMKCCASNTVLLAVMGSRHSVVWKKNTLAVSKVG